MARIQDVVPVFRKVGVLTFLRRLWQQIGEDNVMTWASALAYSWLFALFPFLLFLLTLIPYLPAAWKQDAKHQLAVAVYQLPKQGADTVWRNVEPHIDRLLNARVGSISILSVLLTLWAASGGVNTTMAALDRCYDVEKARPFYKQRPLAVGVTLTEILLILVVLILIPVGTIATRWAERALAEHFTKHSTVATNPASQPTIANSAAASSETDRAAQRAQESEVNKYLPLLLAWQVFRYLLGVGMLLMAVAVIYYFGPNIRQRWRWITPGSIFCVVVWLLLGAIFRVYVDKYGKYDQTYGTVGGVAILLLFFYLDAVVLLIGAEINSEIDYIALNLPTGSRDFTGEAWATAEPAAPSA
jgi:membrane protein